MNTRMSGRRNLTPINGPLLRRNCRKVTQDGQNVNRRRYVPEKLSISSSDETDSNAGFDDFVPPIDRYMKILNKKTGRKGLFTANVQTKIRKSLINQAIPRNVEKSPKAITPRDTPPKLVQGPHSTPFPDNRLIRESSLQLSPIPHEYPEGERHITRRSNSVQKDNKLRQSPCLHESGEEHSGSDVSEHGRHCSNRVHENCADSVGRRSKFQVSEHVNRYSNRADEICSDYARKHSKSHIPIHCSRSSNRADAICPDSEGRRSKYTSEQVSRSSNRADVICPDSEGRHSKSHISEHVTCSSNRADDDVICPDSEGRRSKYTSEQVSRSSNRADVICPDSEGRHSKSHISEHVSCSSNRADDDVICPDSEGRRSKCISEQVSRSSNRADAICPDSEGRRSKYTSEQVSRSSNRADVICPDSVGRHSKSHISEHVSRSSNRADDDVICPDSEGRRSKYTSEQVSRSSNRADAICPDSEGRRSKSHISVHVSRSSNRADDDVICPDSEGRRSKCTLEQVSRSSNRADAICPDSEGRRSKYTSEQVSRSSNRADVICPDSEGRRSKCTLEQVSRSSNRADVICPDSEGRRSKCTSEQVCHCSNRADGICPDSEGRYSKSHISVQVSRSSNRADVICPDSEGRHSKSHISEQVSRSSNRADDNVICPDSEGRRSKYTSEQVNRSSNRADVICPDSEGRRSKCTLEQVSRSSNRADVICPDSEGRRSKCTSEQVSRSSNRADVICADSDGRWVDTDFVSDPGCRGKHSISLVSKNVDCSSNIPNAISSGGADKLCGNVEKKLQIPRNSSRIIPRTYSRNHSAQSFISNFSSVSTCHKRDASVQASRGCEHIDPSEHERGKTFGRRNVSKSERDVSVQTCKESEVSYFTQSSKKKILTKKRVSKSNKEDTIQTSSCADFEFIDFPRRSNYAPWRCDFSDIEKNCSREAPIFNNSILTIRSDMPQSPESFEESPESLKKYHNKRTYFKKKRISLPYQKKLHPKVHPKSSTTKKSRNKINKVLETEDESSYISSSDSVSIIGCFPNKQKIVSSVKKQDEKIPKEASLTPINVNNNKNEISVQLSKRHLSKNKQSAEVVQNDQTTGTGLGEENKSKRSIGKENKRDSINGYTHKHNSDLVAHSTSPKLDKIRRGKSLLDYESQLKRKSIHKIVETLLAKSDCSELGDPVAPNNILEDCERETATGIIETCSDSAEMRKDASESRTTIKESKLVEEDQVETPKDFRVPQYSDYVSHKKRKHCSTKIQLQEDESGYNSNSREVVINVERIDIIDHLNRLEQNQSNITSPSKSDIRPGTSKNDKPKCVKPRSKPKWRKDQPLTSRSSRKRARIAKLKKQQSMDRIDDQNHQRELVDSLQETVSTASKDKEELEVGIQDRGNVTEPTKTSKTSVETRASLKKNQSKDNKNASINSTESTLSNSWKRIKEIISECDDIPQPNAIVADPEFILPSETRTRNIKCSSGLFISSKVDTSTDHLSMAMATHMDITTSQGNQGVTRSTRRKNLSGYGKRGSEEKEAESERKTDTAINSKVDSKKKAQGSHLIGKSLFTVEEDVELDPERSVPVEKVNADLSAGLFDAANGNTSTDHLSTAVETNATGERNQGTRKATKSNSLPYDETGHEEEEGRAERETATAINSKLDSKKKAAGSHLIGKSLFTVEEDVESNPESSLPIEARTSNKKVNADLSAGILGKGKGNTLADSLSTAVETDATNVGNRATKSQNLLHEEKEGRAERETDTAINSKHDSKKQGNSKKSHRARKRLFVAEEGDEGDAELPRSPQKRNKTVTIDASVSTCVEPTTMNEGNQGTRKTTKSQNLLHEEKEGRAERETDTAINSKHDSKKQGNSNKSHRARKRLFVAEESDEGDAELPRSPQKRNKTVTIDASVSTCVEPTTMNEGNQGTRKTTKSQNLLHEEKEGRAEKETDTATTSKHDSKKQGNSKKSHRARKRLSAAEEDDEGDAELQTSTRKRNKTVTVCDSVLTCVETTTMNEGTQGLRRSTRIRRPPYDKTGYDAYLNVRILDDSFSWIYNIESKARKRTKKNRKTEATVDNSKLDKPEKSARDKKESQEKNQKTKDKKKTKQHQKD